MPLAEALDPLRQLVFGWNMHRPLKASPPGCMFLTSAFADSAIHKMSAIASIFVDKFLCDIADMALRSGKPLIDQLEAIRPSGLSWNAWALKAGVSRTIFNDIRRRDNVRHDSLQKLLAAVGVSLADFESRNATVQTEVEGTGMTAEQVREAWAMPGKVQPVPLVGSAFGGDFEGLEDIELTELHVGEVLDYMTRPPSLANDREAYAVRVVGDSMSPRFDPGEMVFVSPGSPVAAGDDVVVQLHNGSDHDELSQLAGRVTMVLIKRMVKRSSKAVTLRQFNPDMTFDVPASRIRRIHRVRGRL